MYDLNLTDEERQEQLDLLEEFGDAMDRDDEETQRRCRAKIKFLPGSLMALKEVWGADFVREQGYNTELADEYYGPGWLDRDD